MGIVGESGCGKSTLAKMVSGSLLPTSGTITLNGTDYTKLRGKKKKKFQKKYSDGVPGTLELLLTQNEDWYLFV